MPARKPTKSTTAPRKSAKSYKHPEADSPMRPDVGVQPEFAHNKRLKKPAQVYRYDSSLSPSLEWDSQNSARDLGEWLIGLISEAAALDSPHIFPTPREFKSSDGDVVARVEGLTDAIQQLKAIEKPFLNWSGKAERVSFDVPTLPLFIHERLSTKAILETVKSHKRDKQLDFMSDLFADPRHSISDQVLKAYEYRDNWVNRMIFGDSLVVMNSLTQYEGLAGQVQMIYMDPPYGVKFGSNFQPFVRKRDVKDNDDADMTREPEMVNAYRDTWELNLHSYLTYLRDRLYLCRDLLAPTGSVFLQISDENLHHVRELMDEVFGAESFISVIPFRKKTMPLGAKHLESICDYIVWYARQKDRMYFQRIYDQMDVEGDSHWNFVELADGTRRKMTKEEINNHSLLPAGSTPCQLMSLYPVGINRTGLFRVEFRGKPYDPPEGNSWFTNPEGMRRVIEANRAEPYEDGDTLRYVLKLSDGPITQVTNMWSDTSAPSDKLYAVQTNEKVIQRCLLMTTRPGDLVLDPTCGGGTTACVAEQWGRRWITIDVSRVPLALARQRLLVRPFPYWELKEESRGPAGGFVYKHKVGKRGEQTGGIVRVIARGTISGEEAPEERVLVDRPEAVKSITRITGPFTFEATIPTPLDLDQEDETQSIGSGAGFDERMLEVLRKSPVLQLGGKNTVTFKQIRKPPKTLSLSAEGLVDVSAPGQNASLSEVCDEAEEKSGVRLPLTARPVAFVFGPENGTVTEAMVFEAAKEANAKNYTHLYVIGFGIQANARQLVENCEQVARIPATYVEATRDLTMGDLLKNTRSSQIFSVCGLPDVEVKKILPTKKDDPVRYQVRLKGLDVFDPVTMEPYHRTGTDVPAWFLDTDYNKQSCFHVCQAFFPRTSAWDNLKRALKGDYEDGVWQHLAGDESTPFEAGATGQIAVKVIDDRGNELLVVKDLSEARQ